MSVGQWKSRVASLATKPLDQVVQGLNNQSRLLDSKLSQIVEGISYQSQLLNHKFQSVIAGIDNERKLLDSRLNRMIACLEHIAQGKINGLGRSVQDHHVASQIPPPFSLSTHEVLEAPRRPPAMNDLGAYGEVFAGIAPWSGQVPAGYTVDFLGSLTSAKFRVFGVDSQSPGGPNAKTRLPVIEDGEGWFEAVNWVVAAREARGSYVMATLGANYGAQAVGSYKALQLLNPMPCKLVAVEPEPDNVQLTMKHFWDNGIDPAQHWIARSAISDTNAPVFFPVGSPGTGAQNCYATNEKAAREAYVSELVERDAAAALRNLLMNNTTGITKSLVPGHDFSAEIKLMSAITLADVLGPFQFVDYLESDIQQSEIVVFPPYMPLLKDKVRRIHIGTHGRDVHCKLHELFERDGWHIVFSYEPNSAFSSALGSFKTNDGVLTVRNPEL